MITAKPRELRGLLEENFLGELCFQLRFVEGLSEAWRATEDQILWQDSSLGRMSLGTPVGPPSISGQSYIILLSWAPLPAARGRQMAASSLPL